MSELIYSETAIENNINNMPDINSLDNMLDLIARKEFIKRSYDYNIRVQKSSCKPSCRRQE